MGRVIPPKGDSTYDASPIVGLKLIRLGFHPVIFRSMVNGAENYIDQWKEYVKKIDYNNTEGIRYVLLDLSSLKNMRYVGSFLVMLKLIKLGFTPCFDGNICTEQEFKSYVKGR